MTVTDEQLRELHKEASEKIREGRGVWLDHSIWLATELALEGSNDHREVCGAYIVLRSMQVTSDTMTEDQIRTLRAELLEESGNERDVNINRCDMALYYPTDPDQMWTADITRAIGRQRCAEIWNDRCYAKLAPYLSR